MSAPFQDFANQAKNAARAALSVTNQKRNEALLRLSEGILKSKDQIIAQNKKDLALATSLSSALRDRLLLSEQRISDMAHGVAQIAKQEDVVFQVIEDQKRDDGLRIQKQRIPIGVIGMVFESRPNVVVDCAALAIKSGNSILLKGGKEASHTNALLGDIVRNSIKDYYPEDAVQVLPSSERALVLELIQASGLVDVVIPRGGEGLIEFVMKNATVPVIAHYKGLCHTYIHHDADLNHALAIILNAKAKRPGVCNAMETLLLHKNLPKDFIKKVFQNLQDQKIELRVTSDLLSTADGLKEAVEEDFATEYLDRILSVKTVDSLESAIAHIQTYGSHHSEAIVATSNEAIDTFIHAIDCSCIMVNASTRFNDGGQLGLGAELGISTTKIHAYGPMGAKEMTTTRYVVIGEGHVRP